MVALGIIVALVALVLLWRVSRGGAWSRADDPAFEAWRRWPEARGRDKLVHAAALAANAHNTQPWLFELANDAVIVRADTDRHIGTFDPFRREMHLSIGCALENLVQAARAQGLEARIELPAGKLAAGMLPPEPAAIVRLLPGEVDETELFRAIPRRHTHRGAYEADREVPGDALDAMRNLAAGCPDLRLCLFTGREKEPLAALITAATRDIVKDPQMSEDNARWFRFSRDAVDRCRDGLTLDANVPKPLDNFFAKLFPPSAARADRHWLQDTENVQVATAKLLGMIAVRDPYDRPDCLQAGRLWQRLHLLLAARGLAAQPLNQPAERADRERQLGQPPRTGETLAALTGDAGWQPTFIFRAGYALHPAAPSPRRPVEDIIGR